MILLIGWTKLRNRLTQYMSYEKIPTLRLYNVLDTDRRFTAEYKLRFLQEAERCAPGQQPGGAGGQEAWADAFELATV